MAYIRKLPSGKWQATVRHPAGHKVSKTDPLKRVVQHWAEETEAAHRRGVSTAVAGRGLTVADWEAQWSAARNRDPITVKKNRSQLDRHVLPKWGTWPLSSITRLDVQTWVTGMTRAGTGAPTVIDAYQLLHALCGAAVTEGHLTISPCRDVELPRRARPAPRWLTEDEYDRLQLALMGTTDEPVPNSAVWQAYVGLAAYSGLRPGELAGLDVGAIDWERSLVWVSQVVTREGLRPLPKTDGSRRSVPFPDDVHALLWRLCADRPAGSVFTAARGGRVSETNFRNRVWAPALAAAGIDYVRPYVLRHTCASWLVQAGVPDRQIMAILGHDSDRLISLYAHLAPTAHDAVRAAWRAQSVRRSCATGASDADTIDSNDTRTGRSAANAQASA